MGPLQYSVSCGSAQEATASARRFPPRACLLKGCERSFRPTHHRCHYCSDACRREAKKWQAWRAAVRWRAKEQGKKCRRAQSRRYRRLIPLTLVAEAPAPSPEPVAEPMAPSAPEPVDPIAPSPKPVVDSMASSAPEPVAAPIVLPPVDAVSVPPEAREGQLIEPIPENFVIRPCLRPGCYVLFGVPAEWSRRHFCCDLCHKALRRVRDREAKYQKRRRAGVRPRRRQSRPVPKPRK